MMDLNAVARHSINLEQRTRNDIGQLWQNQEELRNGLSASEFNLRAHQKMLNAVAVDFLALRDAVAASGVELPDMVTRMAEVELPPVEEGGEPEKVFRPNWPEYHKMIEEELRILAEAEAEAEAEEEAKEEEPAEEPVPETEEADYPEGAAVFGG